MHLIHVDLDLVFVFSLLLPTPRPPLSLFLFLFLLLLFHPSSGVTLIFPTGLEGATALTDGARAAAAWKRPHINHRRRWRRRRNHTSFQSSHGEFER